MNTLPTIKDIRAEGARLHSLGLSSSQWIHISISPDNVKFWAHSLMDFSSVYSETLGGLESAIRAHNEEYSPANKLKEEAAKLGYKLVKEESK